jgi:hypothetical protein
MRLHRTHELLAPWSTGTPVLNADRLAAVRVEPVLRQRRPVLLLDLYLAGDDGDTIVPHVLVDPAVAIERDRDPLIFPFGTPGDDAFALALAARILPHLEGLVLGVERVREHVVEFAPAPRFAAARDAGCFGAAPLRDALTRLAPYQYARRFARGRTVRLDAPDAVGGWALLRSTGTVGIAEGRRDPAASAWYGEAPPAPERAELAVIAADGDPDAALVVVRLDVASHGAQAVVDPLPLDVGIVFDQAEGPVRRWFAVERSVEPAPRELPDWAFVPAGGSSGRIAVLLGRPDGIARPGADTDEARALVEALRAEGFDAALAENPAEAAGADLVHLIGTRDGRRARAVVEAARKDRIPVAVHAHDDDAAAGGWWGATVTRLCFEHGSEERDVTAYLGLLAQRAVVVGQARAGAPYAPDDAAADDAAAALRDASIVFAASEDEAETIRRRTGRRGPLAVVPPLAAAAEPAAVGALVGRDPFVLVHAPIGPLGNQLAVARAAATSRTPLVLAGPVVDASYLERIREFGGPQLVVLAGEPSAELAAGLRRAAGVVVDAAWVGEGASRLAASALAGTVLVVADGRPFEASGVAVRRFDPADVPALTRAIGEAWDDALRSTHRPAAETVAALAPGTAVRAVVRGYAEAAAATPVT